MSVLKRQKEDGAGTRIRTTDFLITNEALYQLSYTGVLRGHSIGHCGARRRV